MVKVKEGFFKRQEALSNDNVLLAHGGHKPLSEFKIGDYLPIAGGTMTGNINFAAGATPSTANGIYFSNGSHLSASGNTLYVFGASGVNIYPTPSSTSGLEITNSTLKYKSNTVLDSGNSSVSGGGSAWGASITVKINNTEKTLQLPSDPNHVEVPGSTNQLAHYKTTSSIGPVTATIGASNNPIWINAGVPTASGASVGSAGLPVYLSSGKITAITGSQMFSAFGSTGTTDTYITIAGYTRTLQIPYATSAGKLSVNAGSTTQAIYFANGIPTALTGTTGAANQPIYLNGGKFTPITYKLNATVLGNTTINRLVHYSSANEIGPVTATIGAGNKIIYINGGVPTASGASVGSATNGIYLTNGVITKMTYNLNATVNSGTQGTLAYYSNATTISSATATIGASNKIIYINGGVPTASSANVGSATIPVYLSSGELKACTLNPNLGYIATTAVQATSTPAQNITGVGNITPNATDTYALGSTTLLWKWTHTNRINLNRAGNASYGRIYYYNSAYYTWVDYMSQSTASYAPTGGQPSTTTEVTSWAKRSLIENTAGYGWIWEATTNAAAGATNTKPTARMSLSSNTGRLRIESAASTTDNNTSGLIISSALNAGSGNIALELWRGTKASWMISNEAGDLHIRDNYTTAAQTTYLHDNVKISHNTGTITAHSIQPAATNTYNLGTSSLRWAKLYIGTADSYGTATKPIYWNAGVPAACTYELKATVNSGTANRIAYYSSATAISAASTLVSDGTYIRRAAVSSSWNSTDDNSMIYQNTINGLGAVLSIKTNNNHSWSIAHYNNESYHTDLLFGFLHADDHTGATKPVNRWRDCISLIPVTDAGTSRRAFVTAPYTRSSATNGKASVGNSTTPVYVDAKGIVVAGQSYAGYGDNRYVLKSGDTMTGTLYVPALGMNMARDTSQEMGIIWYNTSSTRISSITYHNTAQNLILNAVGASNTYSDAVGKYSLIVGNNKLTYNTYPILHAGNYTSYVNPKAVSKTIWGQTYIDASGNFQNVNGLAKITANSNTITIGSQNTTWCHIYNSADIPFIFNKAVYTIGKIMPYDNATHDMGDGTHRWRTLYLSTYVYLGPTNYTSWNSSANGVWINPNEFGIHRTSSGGGFYLHANGVQQARLYLSTLGTAAGKNNASTQGYVFLILGNGTAVGATGTTAGANNSRGAIRIYGAGTNYTDVLAQANGNRNFWLPNYAGVMYAVHAANNNAVGNASTPVYVAANGRVTACSASIGTSAKPIYMSSGAMTACSASIGTSTKPIYMSSGVMTASAASVGSSIRPIYLASGVMTAGATVSTLKGSFYDMKVLWCGIVSKSGATSASYSLNKKGGLCDASVSFSSNTVTVSLSAVSSGSGISGSINICNAIPVVGNWTQRNSSNNYNMGLVTITITSLLTSSVSFQGYARKSDNHHWRINTALGSSWTDGDDVVRITSFYVTIFGFIS